MSLYMQQPRWIFNRDDTVRRREDDRVAMKQSVKILVAIVGDNELFLWLLFWFLSLGFSSSLFHGGGRFGGVVTGSWWWWIR